MKTTIRQFKNWCKSNDVTTIDSMGYFKVGDTVIFTNDFGWTFECKIIGFNPIPNPLTGGVVYLDGIGWWLPKKIKQIRFITELDRLINN